MVASWKEDREGVWGREGEKFDFIGGWRILNLGIPFETGIKIEKIRFSSSGPYSGPPFGTPLGSLLDPFWPPCWTLWGLLGSPIGSLWPLLGRDGNLGDDGKRNEVYGMEWTVHFEYK